MPKQNFTTDPTSDADRLFALWDRRMPEKEGFERATKRINRNVWITASKVSHSISGKLLKRVISFVIGRDRVHTETKAQEPITRYCDKVHAPANEF